jgi:hypothetical protein
MHKANHPFTRRRLIWNHSRESRDVLGQKKFRSYMVCLSRLMEIQLYALSTRLAVWLAQTVEHCCCTPFHKIQRPSGISCYCRATWWQANPQVVRSNPIMSSPNHEKWATCCPCDIIMESFVQTRNHLASSQARRQSKSACNILEPGNNNKDRVWQELIRNTSLLEYSTMIQ